MIILFNATGDPVIAMLTSLLVAIFALDLTIWETFLSWTAMETLISVLGFLGVLLLNLLLY